MANQSPSNKRIYHKRRLVHRTIVPIKRLNQPKTLLSEKKMREASNPIMNRERNTRGRGERVTMPTTLMES